MLVYYKPFVCLFCNAASCDIHMVTELRGKGPGMSTAQLAAQCGHLDTVAALLCHGAKSASRTPDGLGLIHLACLANASQVSPMNRII